MYRESLFDSRNENSLKLEYNPQKKSWKAIAKGGLSVIGLVLLAAFAFYVLNLFQPDSEKYHFYAGFWSPLASWVLSFDSESGSSNSHGSDSEKSDDAANQVAEVSTVTVTAEKSCWIYNMPGSQAEREGYAEKGDVLLYIGKAYADGDPNSLFYKVQYIDKNDNETVRVGFMNAKWGELNLA